MNIKEIQALGQKTNKIIEIEEILKELMRLAEHSLAEETSSITLSINHSCNKDQQSRKTIEKSPIPGFLEHFFPGGFKGTVISTEITIGKPHVRMEFDGKFQLIVIDALISTLKKEQLDLSNQIQKETGN
ncbi:hypothetical protein [Pedobacter sp.]|uniref:hypothetical protein n=1 Tax=Pedobacter sp. TaxID=1411316 RepID=UPI0031DAF68E